MPHPRDMGVPPMNKHGQDARATPVNKEVCKSLVKRKNALCALDKRRNIRYDEVVMFAMVLVEMPCGKGS